MENTQQAAAGTGTDPLVTLLDMAHRARHVGERVELDFLAVNGSHALAPYRQAALWFEDRKVCALSGVVQIEANAPYVQWLERLCAKAPAGALTALDFDGELAAEWAEWLPAYALWLPLPAGEGKQPSARGGLLLARDTPWLEHEISLLTEWCDVLRHAYAATAKPAPWSPFALKSRWKKRMAQEKSAALPWWRRRKVQVALGIVALLCLPVRLTILAPGELVPASPAAIRSPLEGVIERFHVKPNQMVKKGDPLLDFDQAQLDSRYQVASQALATAEAEYRQSLQQALTDSKSKVLLSSLQGKIEERRAESEFLHGQAERARIVAPRDGIALFDDPSEWIGRPVMTGERIMRIATPKDVEIEAWLGVGDAIPLEAGAETSLYLGASPLQAVTARVRYVSYEALPRPDGSYAYRVRATLDGPTEHRVGLKGTAKLTGHWVPAAYWIMRRPLAAMRQMLGL